MALRLGGREARPLVQGGMGIGVSAHRLAAAVAREGCVGTGSSVDLRRLPPAPWRATERSRDKQAIDLPTAVRKLTAFPADRAGLADRGRLLPGCFADLVVFDFEKLADTATFDDPKRYPTGIERVLVNGVAAIEKACPPAARWAGGAVVTSSGAFRCAWRPAVASDTGPRATTADAAAAPLPTGARSIPNALYLELASDASCSSSAGVRAPPRRQHQGPGARALLRQLGDLRSQDNYVVQGDPDGGTSEAPCGQSGAYAPAEFFRADPALLFTPLPDGDVTRRGPSGFPPPRPRPAPPLAHCYGWLGRGDTADSGGGVCGHRPFAPAPRQERHSRRPCGEGMELLSILPRGLAYFYEKAAVPLVSIRVAADLPRRALARAVAHRHATFAAWSPRPKPPRGVVLDPVVRACNVLPLHA
jgi:hypothetical protein